MSYVRTKDRCDGMIAGLRCHYKATSMIFGLDGRPHGQFCKVHRHKLIEQEDQLDIRLLPVKILES